MEEGGGQCLAWRGAGQGQTGVRRGGVRGREQEGGAGLGGAREQRERRREEGKKKKEMEKRK